MKLLLRGALIGLCLLAISSRAEVAHDDRVVLPGSGTAVLGPDDTFEFVIRDTAVRENLRETPRVSAWLLKPGEAAPRADQPENGRAFVVPSPTRSGEYLIHLRGLKSAEKGALDLFLRWNTATGQFKGEARLPGAVAIKESLLDVTLLIDCSLSMELSDPNRQRVEAARHFVELARTSGGIGRVGIIVFTDKVRRLLSLTPVENVAAFEKAFAEIHENGLTDIDGSIREALATLRDESGTISGAVVLLTDGKQEPNDYANAHMKAREAGIPVHTIGLGKSADRTLLKRIAEETGGTCSDAERGEDLVKLYATIAGRIAGGRTIFSAPASLASHAEIPIDGACRSVLARMSSSGEIRIATGDGNESTGAVEHPMFLRLQPPPGKWDVQWVPSGKGDEKNPRMEVSARTPLYPLFFRARPESAAPLEIDPDDPRLSLSLGEGATLLKAASVSVEIELPTPPPTPSLKGRGNNINGALFDDGAHDDGAAGDGVYAASLPDEFSKLPMDATGSLRAVVSGTRTNGEAFRREVVASWSLHRGGPRSISAAPLDFGNQFIGSEATGRIALRMHGPGGPLTATILERQRADAKEQLQKRTIQLKLTKVPAELQSRQVANAEVELRIVENAPEGPYDGEIVFSVPAHGNAPAVTQTVPWKINVCKPLIVAEGGSIDLGPVKPGDVVVRKVRLRTQGGKSAVTKVEVPALLRASAPDWRALLFNIRKRSLLSPNPIALARKIEPFTVDAAGTEVELTFKVAPNALRQTLATSVTFSSDVSRRVTVPITGRVLPAWIEEMPRAALPASEPGDVLSFDTPVAAHNFKPDHIIADIEADTPNCKAATNAKGVAFLLTIPTDARAGLFGFTTSIETGPALLIQHLETRVVIPELSLSSQALDLGSLYPGQSRQVALEASFKGARETPFTVAIDAPAAKPNLGHIRLPESALKLDSGIARLGPETSAKVTLSLTVPQDAQDGVYKTSLTVETRLGKRLCPVSFRVLSPIPLPPFHISPTDILLKVVDGRAPQPSAITITSHVDTELPIRVIPKAGDGYTRPSAELLRTQEGAAEPELSQLLPARGEVAFFARGLPDAADGEFCSIIVEGSGERQQATIHIERHRAPPTLMPGQDRPEEAYIRWLTFLVILAMVLLILLVRALVKQRAVRFFVYAIGVHVAVALIALPSKSIVEALPQSVQLTLLSEEELESLLSPESQRRIDDLNVAGGEANERAPEKPEGSGLAGGGVGGAGGAAGSALSDLKAAPGPSGAPQAQADLGPASVKESAPSAPAAPGTKRAEMQAKADDALSADEAPPAPKPAEPAPSAPELAAAPAVAHVPVSAQEKLDLPLSDEVTEVLPRASGEKVAATAASFSAESFEKAPVAPSMPESDRPATEAPGRDDLPLVADAPEPLVKNVGSARPQKAEAPAGPAQPQGHNVAQALESDRAPQAGTTTREVVGRSAAPRHASETHVGAWKSGTGETLGNGGAGTASSLAGTSRRDVGSPYGTSDTALDAGPALASGNGKSGTGTGTGTGGKAANGDGGGGGGNTPGARGGGGTAALGNGRGGNGSALDGGRGSGGPGGDGLSPIAGSGTGKGAGSGSGLGSGTSGSGGLGLGGEGIALNSIGTGSGIGGTGRGASGTGRGGDAPLDAGGLGKGTGTGIGSGSKPQGGTGGGDGRGNGPAGGDGLISGLGNGRATGIGSGTGVGGLGGLGGRGEGLGGSAVASAARGTLPNATGVLGGDEGSSSGLAKAAAQKGFAGQRPLWGPAKSNALKINLALAKHSGDWDSSPTALYHLATAFKERCGLPEVDTKVKTAALTELNALQDCQVMLITSNKAIVYSDAEIAAMRKFIEGGGTIWVNDSGASGDERFDRAFRKDAARLFPEGKLEAIAMDHTVFSAAYDLKRGYKGYRIPPGDKYRQEYIEGITVASKTGPRLGLIYTRNDYADGLEIDPRSIAGRMSLTDLTAEEMLEGSLRFGINVVAYALGSSAPQMPPPPEGVAEVEKTYRYNGPPLKAFEDFVDAKDADGNPFWVVEDWGNPASFDYAADADGTRTLKVSFKGGDKMKAAVGRKVSLDLSGAKAIVFDLHSALPHGFNVSLLLQTLPDWEGFESRPVFVRPGWNRNLRFPLDRDDFKTAKTDWKSYDSPFRPRDQVARLSVLLYNLEEAGDVRIGNMRIEK